MSAANNFVSDLYAIAHEQQLDATALLRDAGISEEVIGDADIRVERKASQNFRSIFGTRSMTKQWGCLTTP